MRLRKVVWETDRLVWDDLVFRLQQSRSEEPTRDGETFTLYKDKVLVDQLDNFLVRQPDFLPRRILELGIWDGGSAIFWFKVFNPEKLVALDISTRGDSGYFAQYVAQRDIARRVKTYWGVDQADQARLRAIASDEFQGGLDFVIDDASHLYGPTGSSFEALFPMIVPGGFYLIEDWAWGHWREFQGPASPFPPSTEPTRLIWELVEAAGSSGSLIQSLTVMYGFVAVQRGPADIPSALPLSLDKWISRSEQTPQRESVRRLLRLLA
jgi:hypothetical protein